MGWRRPPTPGSQDRPPRGRQGREGGGKGGAGPPAPAPRLGAPLPAPARPSPAQPGERVTRAAGRTPPRLVRPAVEAGAPALRRSPRPPPARRSRPP